jgi:sterol desaturase/sphingolipid hydroxylase (fatty acid hydroxylase superfamily)
LTTWTFLAFLQYVSVEDHCGYDISLLPHSWLLPEPIRGGPVKHDMHHQRPMTNLQPYFAWFDWLTGTDWKPGKDHDEQRAPAGDDHQQTERDREVLPNSVPGGRRSDARQAERPRSVHDGCHGNLIGRRQATLN